MAGADRFLPWIEEYVIPQLNGIARGTGFNRDYSGVIRSVYPWTQESRTERPHFMLDITTEPSPEASGGLVGIGELGNDTLRVLNMITIGVHFQADKEANGPDVITPFLEIRADIHKAMYETRRGPGDPHAAIFLTEIGILPIFDAARADGGTVAMTYGVLMTYMSSDLAIIPGS